jgi:DNA (cytosine-5)-methyltransferase 1
MEHLIFNTAEMSEVTICKPNISTMENISAEYSKIKNFSDFEVVAETETKELKILSLFSGCGGLDLGFVGGFEFKGRKYEKNNFKVIFSNDFDSAATKVYNANNKYFKHEILEKDIAKIQSSEVPEFDFLIGGFPCQPFSNAGLRKGVNDSRGTLFENAIEMFQYSIEKGKKPLGFMFENVRGIMSSKMPDGTKVPDEIVKRMEHLGYNTNYKLVKASNYGVPSNRYRVIIVGFRKEIGYFDFSMMDKIVKEYNIPNEKRNPYDLYLGSVLCDIPENASHKDEYWKYSPAGQKMIENIGLCEDGKEALEKFKIKEPLAIISETITKGRSWKNMNYSDMTPRFQKIWNDPQKYHAPNFYRRFALGEINGTITASAQPENCGITHPFENRRFTVREIARIQSFPDDFVFPYTTIANAYKVIGNAVPPVLGWVFAKSVERFLEKHKTNDKP